jgi:hypothetical protein
MSDTPRDPDLSLLLELLREVVLDSIRTAQPGRIVTYDAAKQRASVQPLINDQRTSELGEILEEAQPVVNDCPVMFLGTSRGRITWPVKANDVCLLLHTSSALSRWVTTGGRVNPEDRRRHDISDAICIVGLHDFANVPTDAPTDAVVVHVSGGTKIKLGSSGVTRGVARSGDDIELDWSHVQGILDLRYSQLPVPVPLVGTGADGSISSASPTVLAA